MRLFLSIFLLLLQTAAAQNSDAFPTPPNAKGLQVQMIDDALKLGIHHAGVNVNLTALYTAKSQPEKGIWAWNESYLRSLDAQIKPLSDAGILVYAIILSYPSKNDATNAVTLHPGHRKDLKFSVAAPNTTNGFLSAIMSTLAERWSGAHHDQGRVWGWIIGNEVNSHWLWNNMGLVSLQTAASEHELAVRAAHTAVRTHSQHARLYLSFDHHWSIGMHGISPQEAVPGRDFLDTFARIARERGDFDWHVAHHPYPEDLGNPRAWADKHITTTDDSVKVTFKNLQVLTQHLEQPALRYAGRSRRVILSEQGFHTLLTPEGEKLQAAAFAYAWEKVSRLPVIDAFIYHRHVDHAKEGGLRLGLWRNAPNSIADPHSTKLIYDLFIKAATPEWRAAADALLPVTELKSWDEK